MSSVFAPVAILLGLVGFFLGTAGVLALKNRRVWGSAISLVGALLLLVTAALCATLSLATRGYHAFTREVLAATVVVRPLGNGEFSASFRFPDGQVRMFSITGDQLYVDARILKWKPIANLLGLHTAYELDRVSGRHLRLEDEQTRPRTVFALGTEKSLDLFDLRRRFPLFGPLVDAEYGSATFITVDEPARFEVRVSTSGLLIREAGGGGA
jgi:hypothetical protein